MLDAHEIEHEIAERVDPVLTAIAGSEAAVAECSDVWARSRLVGYLEHLKRETAAFRVRVARRGPFFDSDVLHEVITREIEPVTQMMQATLAHVDHRLAKLSIEQRAMMH